MFLHINEGHIIIVLAQTGKNRLQVQVIERRYLYEKVVNQI